MKVAGRMGLAARAARLSPDDPRHLLRSGSLSWRAAHDPARNLSLIWFTVWSSLAHAAAMAYDSFTGADQMGHLCGDVAALVLVALVLTLLVRRELSAAGHAELRPAVAR
jgi:hypothetical protein